MNHPSRLNARGGDCVTPSPEVDQRSDQIGRPNEADGRTDQRLARWAAAVRQSHHVVAEMCKHAGEVETGRPFPRVLMLS